jgi:hypothetical protein
MTDVVPEQAVDLDAVLGEDSTPAADGLDTVDEQLIDRLAAPGLVGGPTAARRQGLWLPARPPVPASRGIKVRIAAVARPPGGMPPARLATHGRPTTEHRLLRLQRPDRVL